MLKLIVHPTRTQHCYVLAALHVAYVLNLCMEYLPYVLFSVSHGSTDVLEHILSHDECDVDPINRVERATPLHLTVKIENVELRRYVIDSLLDAGADTL